MDWGGLALGVTGLLGTLGGLGAYVRAKGQNKIELAALKAKTEIEIAALKAKTESDRQIQLDKREQEFRDDLVSQLAAAVTRIGLLEAGKEDSLKTINTQAITIELLKRDVGILEAKAMESTARHLDTEKTLIETNKSLVDLRFVLIATENEKARCISDLQIATNKVFYLEKELEHTAKEKEHLAQENRLLKELLPPRNETASAA